VCNIVLITSCKGGVGKSTVAANLSIFLASAGKRVLLIDCDLGMRCLDLILGMEDRVMYDLFDVLVRNVSEEKAISRYGETELSFLAAPFRYEPHKLFTPERFKEMVDRLVESDKYDYIFIDTAADLGHSMEFAAVAAETALIIATHQPTSIRGAELTGRIIDDKYDIKEKRLIVNEFDFDAVKLGLAPSIIEIIDRTYLQLIGIIPFSRKLAEAQLAGRTVNTLIKTDYNSYQAYSNIYERLLDKNIPLLQGFKNISGGKRKKLLK
jgi:Septum formation inhibitor-activating ATPase